MHIAKWKKPRWKGYLLQFHYKMLCKRLNYRDNAGGGGGAGNKTMLAKGVRRDEQAQQRIFRG